MFNKNIVKVFCNFDLVILLSKYIGDNKSIDSLVKFINKEFKCQFSIKKILDFYCELKHPSGHEECFRCRICYKLMDEHECKYCFDYSSKFTRCLIYDQ